MAREPLLAALALFDTMDPGKVLASHFEKEPYEVYLRLISAGSLQTSSIGRLFDAVAGISGACRLNSYEGEAAMILEKLAAGYRGSLDEILGVNEPDAYFQEMVRRHWEYSFNNLAPEKQAAQLHEHLAGLIATIVRRAGIDHACFSGGVFQNTILLDRIIEKLSGSCKLYFHKNISPNDEGVAYGQLAHHAWGIKKKDSYVSGNSR
jgi:hydrogenase maturation protein HypF